MIPRWRLIMMRVLQLFAGNEFLGGRQVAFAVRTKALEWLEADRSSVIDLDFSGVRGVSHSFSDELLSPLSDALGTGVATRVTISHCAEAVRQSLESVAMLHGLHVPSFSREREACFA